MKTLNEAVPSKPWFRHGLVWMLIAGPALVVVAGLATAYIAMRAPEPVLANDAYEFGQKPDAQTGRSLLPAQKARNHAVTPGDVQIK